MNEERVGDGMGPVKIESLAGFTAAALTTRGPYWKLSRAFARIQARLAEAALESVGPPLGLFYDDPAVLAPEVTRYSICYPLADPDRAAAAAAFGRLPPLDPADTADLAPSEGDLISLIEFAPGPAAVIEYRGPAAESPRVYERLRAWIDENAHRPEGPPREVYLAVPGSLGGGLMHALVQQPLRRAAAPEARRARG